MIDKCPQLAEVDLSFANVSQQPVVRRLTLILIWYYSKTSNIRRTKSQNLIASRLALQLSLPNPMKSGVKSRMKM